MQFTLHFTSSTNLQSMIFNKSSLKPPSQPLNRVICLNDSLLKSKVHISCNQPLKVSPKPVYPPVHTPHLRRAGADIEGGEARLPAVEGASGLLPGENQEVWTKPGHL